MQHQLTTQSPSFHPFSQDRTQNERRIIQELEVTSNLKDIRRNLDRFKHLHDTEQFNVLRDLTLPIVTQYCRDKSLANKITVRIINFNEMMPNVEELLDELENPKMIRQRVLDFE